jgi:hypothetical protein
LDCLEKPESTFFSPGLTEQKSRLRQSRGENLSGRRGDGPKPTH